MDALRLLEILTMYRHMVDSMECDSICYNAGIKRGDIENSLLEIIPHMLYTLRVDGYDSDKRGDAQYILGDFMQYRMRNVYKRCVYVSYFGDKSNIGKVTDDYISLYNAKHKGTIKRDAAHEKVVAIIRNAYWDLRSAISTKYWMKALCAVWEDKYRDDNTEMSWRDAYKELDWNTQQ